MIRTLAEVHADRVTVTVTLDTEASTQDLEKALVLTTTSREFNRGKALEIERELKVAVDTLKVRERQVELLKADVDSLQRQLAEQSKRAEMFEAQAYEQNEQAASERRRASELKDRLDVQTTRADENKEWAERAEARLAQNNVRHAQGLKARDRLLETATRKIREVRETLTTDKVNEARENLISTRATIVCDAIGSALRVLDQA